MSNSLSNFRGAPGAHATVREIKQQPDVWRQAAENIHAQRDSLNAFLDPLLARPDLRIVLTGAGTSAFVGSVAAPVLSRMLRDSKFALQFGHVSKFVRSLPMVWSSCR